MDNNTITVSWHIDDVLEINPQLTEAQARAVLAHVERNHDAEIGINWDVISAAIEALYP